MLWQLFEIFWNNVMPVFALALIGYLARGWLGLEARTLTRYAYYILVPAFVFNLMRTATVDVNTAARMIGFILLVHVAVALLGFGVARALRRPPEMVGAYVMVAVFGNVGNFGLPIIEFRLGSAALVPATLYFLAITVIAFVVAVAAANWHRGGGLGAAWAVFKTPALLALPPALLVNWGGIELPLFVERSTSLLAGAMIPTMLITLGVQLASANRLHFNRDVFIASGVRLIGGPLLAMLIVIPFGLQGMERGAGILQAGMPAAVLASIVALEHKLLPDFVTTTVLVSTVASLLTLTVLLALI
ncbi:MAG: AEC family transporter [Caldilineaceae bacterium]|nr:AEC family transporter [Caldilineaceae bacterium]